MARKVMVLVVAAAVIVAAIVLSFPGGQEVQAVATRRGRVQAFVDEQAKTQLPRTYDITMPFAVRIEPVTLREGDAVIERQLVARLVQQDLDDEVAEAQAAVDRLAARIIENDDVSVEKSAQVQATLFVDAMKSTVAAAAARQTATKSQLDYSETFLGRVRHLPRSAREPAVVHRPRRPSPRCRTLR